VDAQHISFNTASDSRLDIAEFENRCLWAEQIGVQAPDQQAAFYHQAVDLYQADLLVDCYGEWCLVERERLQRIYLNGLDFLVDYHAAREEYREAIDCAARLLACDSLREDVHRKLIEFYLATSQPAAALRQYRECEEVLRRELGTSPAPETQVMLPQIFRAGQRLPGAAGVAPAPVAESPPPTDRTEALASAVNRLREAVTDFDRAHAQLKAAAMAVEGLASPLLQTATPNIDGVREGDDGQLAASVLSEMEQVIALATGAAQRLAVTSPAGGR
jgi:tetratricopeptide (TPR) repeat protein